MTFKEIIKTKAIVLAFVLLVGANFINACKPQEMGVGQGETEENPYEIAMLATALLSTPKTTSTVNFRVLAGGTDISCSIPPASTVTIAGKLNDGSTNNITVQDLRFYISNIRLIDQNDQRVSASLSSSNTFQDADSGVALLDFEDKSGDCAANGTVETNTSISITYPVGSYKGIEFDVGIPDSANRLYYAASPAAGTPAALSWSSMYWSWASSYKFTRIEFKDSVSASTSVLHLGSTGDNVTNYACDNSTLTASIPASADNINPGVGNPCKYYNRPTITLTAPGNNFDPAANTVALELDSLFNNAGWGMGGMCMSGRTNIDASNSTLKANCTNIFANIGVSATDGSSTGTQTSFVMQ